MPYTIFHFKSKHIDQEVFISTSRYEKDGSISIKLLDPENGQTLCTCTVCLPICELAWDEVIIKDYSENEGMVDGLIAAAVIHESHRSTEIAPGSFHVPICRLTDTTLGLLIPSDYWPDITPDYSDDDLDDEIITITRDL